MALSVCKIGTCRWTSTLTDQTNRDRAWLAHWRSEHAGARSATTRCPFCTWTSTSSDLDQLRDLARSHRTTCEGIPR